MGRSSRYPLTTRIAQVDPLGVRYIEALLSLGLYLRGILARARDLAPVELISLFAVCAVPAVSPSPGTLTVICR